MFVHLGMSFTDGGAGATNGATGFSLMFDHIPIGLRLAHKRLCSSAADLGAIKV